MKVHRGMYCKVPKFSDATNFAAIYIKFKQRSQILGYFVKKMQMELQTVYEQSDLGLHCLPRPICPKTYDHYRRISRLIMLVIEGCLLSIMYKNRRTDKVCICYLMIIKGYPGVIFSRQSKNTPFLILHALNLIYVWSMCGNILLSSMFQ